MRVRTAFPLLITLAVAPAHAVGPNNALNDTGITRYGDAVSNVLTSEPAGYPGQDARFGRDPKASAGVAPKAGFDFTALDAFGNPTTPSSGANPHPCVRDNVTELVWEVKTANGGLRDRNWKYFWFDSNSATNGGNPGTESNGLTDPMLPSPPFPPNTPICPSPGNCDTEKYVVQVNAAASALCGFRDWRTPTIKELESIVDFSRVSSTTIDPTYFPNTVDIGYYSGSAYAPDQDSAWFIDYFYGFASTGLKNKPTQVRLVRGGP